MGSRVAIKILSQECAREPELVDRFFAEARAVNLIRHENIVSVIDMAKLPDGRPFIVMEYIEGVTLGRVIKGGRAPLGGIVQVFSDVLSALEAAHAIGIVHRDLKPDNILITGKGHAKVLDFGIAKLAPALRSQVGARTETGALLGTPAYMAPEQISGKGEVDGRSDVYGAGVVLFEAVTGRVPFTNATLFDMMRAQLEDAPPSPCALRDDLPQAMEAVILTALAKQPAMRFQSAAAMANALEQASAELPQAQWRELSTRSARLSRGSAPRVRPPTTAPPPMTIRNRDTPPAMSAVNMPRSAENKKVPSRSRRPLVLVALGMCVAGIVGAIIATAAHRGDDERPAEVVSQVQPAPAPVPVVVVDAAPIALVDAAPPAAPTKPKHAEVAPAKSKSKQLPRAVPVADAQPSGPPPPRLATIAEEERAKIADEYKMHRDHVALPGEIPIKRRPRMSRGKYDPKRFDYRAFMPQALKLARAEFADAQLVSFDVGGVGRDGVANITLEHHGAEFRFTSNSPIDEGCVVHIDVHPNKIETYIERSGMNCGEGIPPPRCTLARVWEKMLAQGTTSERARISYHKNGWIFSGASGGVLSLDDDCR
ncbi:MAG: serine/threonine protein kinase [Deltaproteobacteria bacterium]|nr:serine/threonine protein kinase [Deltaproteobacteria bacterium]